MKQKNVITTCIGWVLISTIVMCLLPVLVAVLVPSDAGMMACLILFFVVNPIYSAAVGIVAGKKGGLLLIVPVVSALMFILGTWILFGLADYTFVLYAAYYLLISVLAVFMVNMLSLRKRR